MIYFCLKIQIILYNEALNQKNIPETSIGCIFATMFILGSFETRNSSRYEEFFQKFNKVDILPYGHSSYFVFLNISNKLSKHEQKYSKKHNFGHKVLFINLSASNFQVKTVKMVKMGSIEIVMSSVRQCAIF
jgi:hypothetical protein